MNPAPSAMPALVEYILFFSFVGIGLFGGIWIWCYGALGRRLQARGVGPAPGPSGRINGMDRLFSKLRFLIGSEDRALGDRTISSLCWSIKLCSACMLLMFLAMVFGPFFLAEH